MKRAMRKANLTNVVVTEMGWARKFVATVACKVSVAIGLSVLSGPPYKA